MSTQPFDDTGATDARTNAAEERYYLASSWTLMRRRFMKHKLALVGGTVLLVVYFFAIFAGFFSVADPFERHPDHTFAPPTRVRLFHEGKLHRPFVYGLKTGRHPVTRAKVFEINGRFSGTTPLRHHAGFPEVDMVLRHTVLGESIASPTIEPMTILRHWSETIVRPHELLP